MNYKQPIVSVIIPTFNRREELREAIRSVINQRYRNLEIIVVNDGGEDVKDIIPSAFNKGEIIYTKHKRNNGPAATRNTGIKLANGKYIAYLDDDDIFYPEHIETLVDFLEHTHFRVAYTDAYRVIKALEGNEYKIVGKDIPLSVDFSKDILLIKNITPVLCLMHEKKCIEEVGLFDEDLLTHEDWDLWIRMSRKFDFAHIKKVTAEYTWIIGGNSLTFSKRADFFRTMKLIYARYKEYATHNILESQKRQLAFLQTETLEQEDMILFIYYTMGSNYERQGRLDKAMEKFEYVLNNKSVAINLKGGAHFHLGCIYKELGEKEKARYHFEECLKIIPDHKKAKRELKKT